MENKENISDGVLMYSPEMFNKEGFAIDYIRVTQTNSPIGVEVDEFYFTGDDVIDGAIQLPLKDDFFEKAMLGESDYSERLMYVSHCASNSISMFLNFNDEYRRILKEAEKHNDDVIIYEKCAEYLESKIGTSLDFKFKFVVKPSGLFINIKEANLLSDDQISTVLKMASHFVNTPIFVISVDELCVIGYSYSINDVRRAVIIEFKSLRDSIGEDSILKLLNSIDTEEASDHESI